MSHPLHTLVQLSDLHVDAAGPLYGRVDTVARLRAAMDLVLAMEEPPDAVLVTGDLANNATPEDYGAVRAVLEPAMERLGRPLLVIPGNHDLPAPLREHVLGAGASPEPLDGVLRLGGLRVIGLDSTIPGEGSGAITDPQLAWLAAELAEPAPDGTILALHHPPLPSPVGLFDLYPLRDPERLVDALRGSDVRMVLTGHAHHLGCGSVAGIPVWVAPAVCYSADVTSARERFRGILGGTGLTRIDVFPESVVATFVPLDGREVVDDVLVADVKG